jgi:arylsulfatase A-like enzyme
MTAPLLLALLTPPAWGQDDPAPQPNIVLVSFDTTRIDAISAYGKRLPGLRVDTANATPILDRLAADGVRFEQFWALSPTTLNSHATMFTGLTPHEHGVPRNGATLAEEHVTLAERLGEAGWDTIGVVGSAALEGELGIAQGFRVWDDNVDQLSGVMYQHPAHKVVERTLAAVTDRDKKKPLFLFVHFYDAHAPYQPPGPFKDMYAEEHYQGLYRTDPTKLGELQRALESGQADPTDVAYIAGLYQGEVSFMDNQLGRLLAELKNANVLEHTLVVVTADHGEVLSERPIFAYSHGTDVSEGAMHIPLIMRGFGVPMAQRAVVERQASLDGLAPTIERIAGLEATLGRDFYDHVRPGPVRDEQGWPERPTWPVMMEATRPLEHESKNAWNNLRFYRGIRAGGWALEGAPVFGIDLDFLEADAVPVEEHDVRPVLAGEMALWDANAPPYVEVNMPPAQRRALIELGYIDVEEAASPEHEDQEEPAP